jgi:hypothetical protein
MASRVVRQIASARLSSLRGATRRRNPPVSPHLSRRAQAGLPRGACHRARIRATRWLAMTMLRTCHILSRHHPRKRMIQYSETTVMESKSRGVLDPACAGYD